MKFRYARLRARLLPLFVSGLSAAAMPAFADDKAEIDRLKSLIEELDQRVKIVDRKLEISNEEAAAKQKSTAVLTASDKGFGLKSADGQFEYKLRGLVQLDYRNYEATPSPAPSMALPHAVFAPHLKGLFLVSTAFASHRSLAKTNLRLSMPIWMHALIRQPSFASESSSRR